MQDQLQRSIHSLVGTENIRPVFVAVTVPLARRLVDESDKAFRDWNR